jgi:hypothetical protein
MIEAKADINHENAHGYNAFSAAIEHSLDCLYLLLDHTSGDPASDRVKSVALFEAFSEEEEGTLEYLDTQRPVFALLACGADIKGDGMASPIVPSLRHSRLQLVVCNVLGFIDSWHGVAVTALSDLVEVDTRVGRGDNGIYQEPLERVLQYLGLSMSVDQVVNTNVDGKSVRRALISNQARCANQWHTLFKHAHCASCGVCPKQKMKACPCKTVWYCNTDCQRKHWKKEHAPDHKQILKAQEEERKKKKEEEERKKKDAK